MLNQLFIKKESVWLEDYALFTAIKHKFEGAPWTEWDDDLKKRKKTALDKMENNLINKMSDM